MDYNDIVYYPLPVYQLKRLQKVQNACASFVTGKYTKTTKAIVDIGWLPVKERRDLHYLKATFKALHNNNWPDYLKLDTVNNSHGMRLRSSAATKLVLPKEENTFQFSAAKLFNALPPETRNCKNFFTFIKQCKTFLLSNIANSTS